MDAGDRFQAEESVFDLGGELGVGGFVGGGGGEAEGGEVAGRDAGDGGSRGFKVAGEVSGADEAEIDDVAVQAGVVAVAESMEEVGVGHRGRGWTGSCLFDGVAVVFEAAVDVLGGVGAPLGIAVEDEPGFAGADVGETVGG